MVSSEEAVETEEAKDMEEIMEDMEVAAMVDMDQTVDLVQVEACSVASLEEEATETIMEVAEVEEECSVVCLAVEDLVDLVKEMLQQQ